MSLKTYILVYWLAYSSMITNKTPMNKAPANNSAAPSPYVYHAALKAHTKLMSFSHTLPPTW